MNHVYEEMKMKKKVLMGGLLLALVSHMPTTLAANNVTQVTVPQPSSCVTGVFKKTGDQWWVNVELKLTNTCGQAVDVQNMSVTFNSADNLNTSFWGQFGSVAYPDSALQIRSQANGSSGYLSSLSLHFPEANWANKQLGNNQSIILQYGAASSNYEPNSVKVYLNGQQIQVGQIDITNTTAKPSGVSQDAWVGIKSQSTNQVVARAQVAWGGTKKSITGLAPDTYLIQPENSTSSGGDIYAGEATPASVAVKAGETLGTTIVYTKVIPKGKVLINVQNLPAALSGYTLNPIVTLTRKDTNSTQTQGVAWGMTSTVSQLATDVGYRFSAPDISYNGAKCTASFTPIELISSENNPQTTQLSYACTVIKQVQINLNIDGLNEADPQVSSIDVNLTPNDGTTPVSKRLSLTNGEGTDAVNLTEGVIYHVSASTVDKYTVSYTPQLLTAVSGATAKISYVKQAASGNGVFVAYFPTWFTPVFNAFCPTTDPRYFDLVTKTWKSCTAGQVLPDDHIIKASVLAGGIPDYVTHVILSFAKLNRMRNYQGLSHTHQDLRALGLDYNGSSASLKESIRVLKLKNPGTKVILALGGASYNDSWDNVTSQDKTKAIQLMKDLGLDGLDVDYEKIGTSPALIDQYYHSIVAMREIIDGVGNGAILTLAGWSTGADCTIQTPLGSTYPDCVKKSVWWKGDNGTEGNHGRERIVLQGRGANSMIDLIGVMSYDANYDNFDPVIAYKQYKAIAKPGAVIALGIQPSPDEGWGHARTYVHDRGINNDCVGNTILQDQYGTVKPGTFSVQRFANVVKENPGDGFMMWSLFAYRAPLNCGSVPISTVTELGQGVSEYLGIGTDRTTQIDYNTMINYGRY